MSDKPAARGSDSDSKLLSTADAIVDKLVKRSKTDRRIIIALVCSFVLDVALTITVAILSANALSQASATHTSQLVACRIGNSTRSAEIALWEGLVKLSPPKNDQERKQDAVFIAFVQKTFKTIDCAKLYGKE